MSFTLMKALVDRQHPDIKPATLHVLLVLVSHADEETFGSCFPSLDTIARKANRGKRTVQRAIKQAEEQGYIEIGKRVMKEHSHNDYQINTNKFFSEKWPKGEVKSNGQSVMPNGQSVMPSGQIVTASGQDGRITYQDHTKKHINNIGVTEDRYPTDSETTASPPLGARGFTSMNDDSVLPAGLSRGGNQGEVFPDWWIADDAF